MTMTTTREPGAPTPPLPRSPWLGPVRVTGAVLGAGLIGLGAVSVVM